MYEWVDHLERLVKIPILQKACQDLEKITPNKAGLVTWLRLSNMFNLNNHGERHAKITQMTRQNLNL